MKVAPEVLDLVICKLEAQKDCYLAEYNFAMGQYLQAQLKSTITEREGAKMMVEEAQKKIDGINLILEVVQQINRSE